MSNIRYLKRSEIDEPKWNSLITKSVNSLPYAFSWYLDAITEWDALVLNDYDVVMPLPKMRKLGIKCLYQPYYCQQLGFFYKKPLTSIDMSEFIAIAIKEFPYINFNLNPSAEAIANTFEFSKKRNLLLDLSSSHKKISGNYSAGHRRNILKANKKGLVFTEEVALKSFQKFYIGNVDTSKEVFKPKHAKIFTALTSKLITDGTGKIFAANSVAGQLLAAVLIINHPGRLIGIINTSSAAGKQSGAAPFVFDQIIQKYAGSDLVFDFEGSSIPGIARFYQGFGAQEEWFYNYQHTIVKSVRKVLGV